MRSNRSADGTVLTKRDLDIARAAALEQVAHRMTFRRLRWQTAETDAQKRRRRAAPASFGASIPANATRWPRPVLDGRPLKAGRPRCR